MKRKKKGVGEERKRTKEDEEKLNCPLGKTFL